MGKYLQGLLDLAIMSQNSSHIPSRQFLITFIQVCKKNQMNNSVSCYWPTLESVNSSGFQNESPPQTTFYFVMFPVLLVICTFGNGLTLVVTLSGTRCSSTQIFLSIMATCNLGFL